jgi:hypothetical protein
MTTRRRTTLEGEMLAQLILALDVYEAIELFERENEKLPALCGAEFERWRQWRIKHGLEKERKDSD